MEWTLHNLYEHLGNPNYKSNEQDYQRILSGDEDQVGLFNSFVDKETHRIIMNTGLFEWNAKDNIIIGLSPETYAHCRFQVKEVVAEALDRDCGFSKHRRLLDYFTKEGLIE